MLIYILRHANADTEAATDDERRLSEKGKKQAQRAAQFCVKHEITPAVILASPLPRARETAEPVAAATNAPVEVVSWLASGMKPIVAEKELKEYQKHPSIMLVGHEPDLSSLVAMLTGLPSNDLIHVRKASLTLLETDVLISGHARLEFSIPCKMM